MRKMVTRVMVCIGLIVVCGAAIIEGVHNRYMDNSGEFRSEMEDLFIGAGIEITNDIEYVDAVRNYAYENLEWAFGSKYRQDITEQIFGDKFAWKEKVLGLFQQETIEPTGYCGGTAYALAVCYNALGYNSCSLDMAVFEHDAGGGYVVDSHVVTLVEVEDEWIVEDASFNITYVNEDHHLPIQELIKEAREGNGEVQRIEGSSLYKRGCFEQPVYEGTYPLLESAGFEAYDMGYYSYVNLKPEFWSTFSDQKLYPYFEKDGYEAAPLSMYAYPYKIYWPRNCVMNRYEQIQIEHMILDSAK